MLLAGFQIDILSNAWKEVHGYTVNVIHLLCDYYENQQQIFRLYDISLTLSCVKGIILPIYLPCFKLVNTYSGSHNLLF